jgi:hypothetical protein
MKKESRSGSPLFYAKKLRDTSCSGYYLLTIVLPPLCGGVENFFLRQKAEKTTLFGLFFCH